MKLEESFSCTGKEAKAVKAGRSTGSSDVLASSSECFGEQISPGKLNMIITTWFLFTSYSKPNPEPLPYLRSAENSVSAAQATVRTSSIAQFHLQLACFSSQNRRSL
ncbi:hypothetical protein OIU79_018645 [Salix purpurea]|uniref:Uncharacterized protein n=1 Tax=Salix purpurea TaxID=77065 RepID=A0A9Q0WZ76_SALPP|nr:hypothetical protein OIU79_018645 [Salix purpurea]